MKKKLLSLTTALSIMATMGTSVFASEPVSNVSSEISILSQNTDTMDYNEFVAYTENVETVLQNMVPMTSESYYDYDEKCLVTSSIYVIEDNTSVFTTQTKSETFIKKETKNWAGTTSTTAYVKGYFTYGNGNISVSNTNGWYETTSTTSGTKVIYESQVTGVTGTYWGKKYIELRYNIISENTIGNTTDISTKLRVYSDGSNDANV